MDGWRLRTERRERGWKKSKLVHEEAVMAESVPENSEEETGERGVVRGGGRSGCRSVWEANLPN